MANTSVKVDTLKRESPMEIPNILANHWNTAKLGKKPVSVQLYGEVSTVKSRGVESFSRIAAEESGREFVDWNRTALPKKEEVTSNPAKYYIFADLRASSTDVAELRLQEMNNGKPWISFKYNVLFVAMSHPESMGMLFLDEMNLAPTIIKSQFYQLVNDHCIGDLPLSNKVMVVSAGNEVGHARGVQPEDAPLTTRRCNYFIRPLTDEEYADYSVQTGQSELISAYVKAFPADVHRIDYDSHDGTGQPCPRTWSMLSDLILANPEMADDMMAMHARAAVGQGTATKFMSFAKMAKKVDIDAVLKRPELIKEYEQDLSLLYAVITGSLEKFRNAKAKHSDAIFEMSLYMREELGVFMLRQMKSMVGASKFKTYVMDAKKGQDVAERFTKFFS